MAEQATYSLKVDWNADGDFDDVGEDISADWMNVQITRGYNSPLARMPSVSRATFLLKNSAKSYSPPLEANVLPRREVQFQMTYGGTTKTLFRGFIDSIVPTFGTRLERRCTLNCVDAMALLDLYEGEISLLTDTNAGEIIEDVVDAAYTPPADNYQVGINAFPTSAEGWAHTGTDMERVKASQKIEEACRSDWGRFFINKAGEPTFYNRHQMPLDTTTDLTLDDDMLGMAYKKAVGTIYNYVEVTCYPRHVGTDNEVLARLSQRDAPRIEGSDSRIFVLRFRDPVDQTVNIGGKDVITPVAATDFNCTDEPGGEGTDENSNITPSITSYGDHAEVTLANGAAYPVYVQDLQVRGLAVRAREKVGMVAQDATSIAAYQKRKLAIQCPLMSDQNSAQGLADYLLDVYKDPIDDVSGIEIIANKDATWMAAVRDLELMDRVVVTESQTGLNAYAGYIYQMTHTIDNKWNHRLTFSLETAYDVGGTPFRIEISTFDSGHILIY